MPVTAATVEPLGDTMPARLTTRKRSLTSSSSPAVTIAERVQRGAPTLAVAEDLYAMMGCQGGHDQLLAGVTGSL
jgi:hypothetical protein